MARWDTPFEIEKVKQPALIAALPTHHDPTSSLKPSTKRNHDSTIISTTFSTLSVKNCLDYNEPARQLCLCEFNWSVQHHLSYKLFITGGVYDRKKTYTAFCDAKS